MTDVGPDSARLVEALRSAVGDAVSTDAVALAPLTTDRSGHDSQSAPLALVTARSIADVQATMRVATEFRVGVVTRGAGTGLAGGAIAGAGEIVLSTLALNRILDVSVADEFAVVEPGILNGDLNSELARRGLWFTPDPASRAISTVGGNIATNAGGLLCAKYGVTRESVLGLKVVLADGRMLTLGHRSVKGVTGLDLTALLIGSEGTLAVIVEATVRLRRLPTGAVVTIGAWFSDVVTAAAACAAITAAGLRPAALELMDAAALSAIDSWLGEHLPSRGEAFVLFQADGAASATEAAAALEIFQRSGGDAELTTDPTEGERLFAIRRAFHPALEAQGNVLIEDVAVPRTALPLIFAEIRRIGERHGISIPTVAHAGDGNLHPNFVYRPEADGRVPAVIWTAAGELFAAALRLGGTLTGEHGVGLLKRAWLRDELGDDQLDLQRRLKSVFDPLGILNPGKVFPPDAGRRPWPAGGPPVSPGARAFLPFTRADALEWNALRDEISPWIGERAVTLFSYALSQEYGSEVTARYFRDSLTAVGDDPDRPQVTETEQLLIDWGRLIVRSPGAIPDEVNARLESAFGPERRVALLTFASRIVAMGLVHSVGRAPEVDWHPTAPEV